MIRHRLPRAVLLLSLLAILAPAGAAAQESTFSGSTSVVVVEVPVTVTRDGEPVRGLGREDFEILDNGKKQEILGFEVIDLGAIDTFDPRPGPGSAGPEWAETLPVAARRHFLFLFDMAFSQPESIVKARRAALEVADDLHPTDLAGVALYTSSRGAEILLGFTSDRRQLELVIETLGVPQLLERRVDPLAFVAGDARSFAQRNVVSGSAGGGRGSAELDQQLLEAAARLGAAERGETVRRISSLTSNLETLAERVAALEGQKHVVYFSEGFSSETLLGRGYDTETLQAREFGEIWNVDAEDTFGSTQAQNELEAMLEAFRRAGCAIQAVNIAGLRTENEIGARQPGEDSLTAMARDTGGEYLRNFNDLGEALGQVLEATSVTYLLAFQPTRLERDGDFHRLKVRLRNGRGMRLSHRAGYFAPRPFNELDEDVRRLSAAETLLRGTPGGALGVEMLAAPFEVPGEPSYVPVLIEIDGADVLAGGANGTAELELYAYAFDDEGAVHDFFTQRIGLDLGQFGDFLARSGIKFWGHFDLGPGNYSARLVVRDRRDGRASLARQLLRVPDFAAAEPLLLPPLFPEPPQAWLMTREEESRQRQVDYPFLQDGAPFIPAARPALERRGAASFQVEGFYLPAAARFAAAVLDADGQPAEKARVELDPPVRDGVRTRVAGRLHLRHLQAGDYVLAVTARDDAAEHESAISFTVP